MNCAKQTSLTSFLGQLVHGGPGLLLELGGWTETVQTDVNAGRLLGPQVTAAGGHLYQHRHMEHNIFDVSYTCLKSGSLSDLLQ